MKNLFRSGQRSKESDGRGQRKRGQKVRAEDSWTTHRFQEREREGFVHGITNHRKTVRDEFSTKPSRNSLKKRPYSIRYKLTESNS